MGQDAAVRDAEALLEAAEKSAKRDVLGLGQVLVVEADDFDSDGTGIQLAAAVPHAPPGVVRDFARLDDGADPPVRADEEVGQAAGLDEAERNTIVALGRVEDDEISRGADRPPGVQATVVADDVESRLKSAGKPNEKPNREGTGQDAENSSPAPRGAARYGAGGTVRPESRQINIPRNGRPGR